MRPFHTIKNVVIPAVALLLLCAGPALAQQDPSIRNWGSPEGFPPPWQTPDIWVDNNGNGIDNPAGRNEVGEPSIGIANQLFAQIRNLGPSAISGDIVVRFAFAPYGLWSPASHADFKEIGVIAVHGLGAAGAADAEKTAQITWDLSNLMEDNGGAWGGFTVGDFQHFCILVTLTSEGDANPSNNLAQNNFGNVPISAGLHQSVKFMIANPKPTEAVAEVLVRGLPESWKSRLEGAQQGRFVLKAREFRPVVLTFTPPRPSGRSGRTVAPDTAEASAHVDVALKLDGAVVGGLSFDAREPAATPGPPPAGGSLSPYLIGTYDLRSHRQTTFQIVNPTGRPLRVQMAFFDDNEKPLACVRESLSPNKLLEIDARRHVQAKSGVVKIVSFDVSSDRPVPGVVGYQRTFSKAFFYGYRLSGETILHAIPADVLAGDLWMIRLACP